MENWNCELREEKEQTKTTAGGGTTFSVSRQPRNAGRRKSFFPLLFFRRDEELRKSFVVGKASGKRSWAEILGMEDCAQVFL